MKGPQPRRPDPPQGANKGPIERWPWGAQAVSQLATGPEERMSFTHVPAPYLFLSLNTLKHKEQHKDMAFRFPRILFAVEVSGSVGTWVVLLKSYPFHCSQPWIEKDTFSRLWEHRPFLQEASEVS